MGQCRRIQLEQLHILDADEDGILSDGDEPYLVAIGFRSRFRTPGSTQVFWDEMLDDTWGNGAKAGDTKAIPPAMGVLTFPDVSRPTLAAIAGGEMPEVLGTVVIAMESDATPFSDLREGVHKLEEVVRDQVADVVERGNIDLQHPQQAIQHAVKAALDALKPGFGGIVAEVLRS
jgi:hypothetical protein